ncbi:penicillin amidase [Roseovarius spongiae]|uniref:Penicillin amidase n=1 Tax=Roseovarius spongiae TaxID=2320272 RepID=A0A3A8B1P8_9RHOB|nr:penicillin acylase family protein [Roseovarius spongiae]RKF12490.1 penicillin amidase [Roseovarius spongiae]
MKRLFNILLRTFVAAVVAGLVVTGGAYFLLSASVPDYDEDFEVAGIEGPVEVLRDSSAIPHVTAASFADIYFAIGFVHAQDRLGQLLRARRAAENLPLPDRAIDLEPSLSDALEAYAAGVNAWIGLVSEGGRGRGSPELLIAGERTISVWRPEDSLRIARSFLNNLQPRSGRQRVLESPDVLFPADRPKTPEMFATLPEVSLNAWALPGSRTANGIPILAADINGPLSVPSEWYLADLQFPTGAAIGATLPGIPFVVVGRTDRVAWAFRSSGSSNDEQQETPSVSSAGNFLTMLDRFARSADAQLAVDAAADLSPAGLEVVAVDRESVARWPEASTESALSPRSASFREYRLATLDDRQPIFSVESAIAVQRDTVSSAARTLLPLMAREIWFVSPTDSTESTRADPLRGETLDRLAQWNGDMDRISPEPLVFWAWVRALQRRILKDEFPATNELWAKPNPEFLYAVLSNRDGSATWCDIRPSTPLETCDDQILAALDESLGWLVDRYGSDPSAWSWGAEHTLKMAWSPIRSGGIVGDLVTLEAPASGAPNTQTSTLFTSDENDPFDSKAGTNFQTVMSLSEEGGSYFIAPAGQSGHPFSRFFENLFPMWTQGEYLVMSTDLSLARGGAVGEARLSPIPFESSKSMQEREQ